MPRKVKQRHLDRAMGAGVPHERMAQRPGERRAHPRILADEQRLQILDRGHQAAERVAGHGRRRRRLPPADSAVGRFDPHQQVVSMRDGDARHAHCFRERKRNRNEIDPFDDEGSPRERGRVGRGASGRMHGHLSRCRFVVAWVEKRWARMTLYRAGVKRSQAIADFGAIFSQRAVRKVLTRRRAAAVL